MVDQLGEESTMSPAYDTETQDKPCISSISELNCMTMQGDSSEPLDNLLKVKY